MDVIFDTSSLSKWARDPDLLGRVKARILTCRLRLGLPIQALSEAVDSDQPSGIGERLACVKDLSDQLGERFFLTQDVDDLLRIERYRRITSVPAVPRAAGLLESLRSPDLLVRLPEIRMTIRKQQRKDDTFARDRSAREDFGPTYAAHTGHLGQWIEGLQQNDWFWTLAFVRQASHGGTYARLMRQWPARYGTAIIMATYAFLNAMGSVFADGHYGQYAGLLRAPRRNDWVDAYIASCASHARFFVTEDEGQRKKVAHIAREFRLRLMALETESWLSL